MKSDKAASSYAKDEVLRKGGEYRDLLFNGGDIFAAFEAGVRWRAKQGARDVGKIVKVPASPSIDKKVIKGYDIPLYMENQIKDMPEGEVVIQVIPL